MNIPRSTLNGKLGAQWRNRMLASVPSLSPFVTGVEDADDPVGVRCPAVAIAREASLSDDDPAGAAVPMAIPVPLPLVAGAGDGESDAGADGLRAPLLPHSQ